MILKTLLYLTTEGNLTVFESVKKKPQFNIDRDSTMEPTDGMNATFSEVSLF